jgi:hypothetical protein
MPAAAPRNQALPAAIDRLIKQAKADPKKAGTLGVLLVVMVVMWARMAGGSTPGAARATPAGGPGAYPGGAAGGLAGANESARAAARANSAQASFEEFGKRQIVDVSRNLFVINYDFFPQDGSRPAQVLRAPTGNGFWDQVEKSMTARADHKKEREVLVENLRLQAAQLKVQSTVMSASPQALVNGELVGVGDVVASFRVSKIEARRIVVEREGIKLEIRFN